MLTRIFLDCRKSYIVIFLLFVATFVQGQTTLISPTGDGGFENGGTFASNGWTVSNSANNPWFVGPGAAPIAGVPFAGNRAYVSDSPTGVTTNYNTANPCINYFYRDVSVPAGETKLNLTFNSLTQGENNWDMWQVFVAPTTTTPLGVATHPGSTGTLVPTALTGATYIGNSAPNASIQNVILNLPPNLAGTTFRLIFAWKSDTSSGTQPPASIDNISLVSAIPSAISATANGGLWSSPATWVSGIVPNNDIVTIPAGSTVTVDQVISQNSIAINGVLQWGATSFALSVVNDLTIGTTGKFFPHNNSSVPVGQTLNVGGNFTNNGYANLATASTAIFFNGSQVGGSTNQNISGSGLFEGNGTEGYIRALLFASNGTFNVNTTQNLVITSTGGATSGTFNTNGKLRIDNTLQVYGQPYNVQVSNLVVTNMGAGYAATPVVYGASVSPFALGGSATLNTRYFFADNVYLATTAGTFDAAVTPTHTAGSVTNGTVPLLWLSKIGNLGNPFIQTAVTIGTQYFYGDNLYVATVAGAPSITAPPTHVSGAVASGAATFLYVGTVANATVNYDGITSTVRSLNLISPGNGYSSSPPVVISSATTAPTTPAVSTSLVNTVISGAGNSLMQKSGIAVISGSLPINSDQNATQFSGVGSVFFPNGGVNYTTAPTIGFSPPTAINLVTNGGSGYTTAPTITITGTPITGTAPAYTVVVSQGKIVSVYVPAATATSAVYATPPTLAVTGGGGTGATVEFPAGSWPVAIASIGTNGQISNTTVTNTGFGYVAPPTVGIGNLSGTPNGGTFTTAAGSPSARIGLYNLTYGFFIPAASNIVNTEGAEVPTNRKVNNLTINTASGANFTNNLTLINAAPITFTSGIVNMGTNTLSFANPNYAGTAGSTTSHIVNGSIKLNSPGGSVTRTFPFDANVIAVTGTGSLPTGSTITSLTVSRLGAPTGTVSPSGNPIGNRTIRVLTGTGEVYGTAPSIQVNYNAADGLVSDNAGLSLAQSTTATGPWTIMSATAAAGVLPATGNRITAAAAPGPFVSNAGDDYFAFTSTFVAYISAQTGDWNVGSTWVGGVVPPPSCENVVIKPTHIVTSSTASNVCKSLTIDANGELRVTGGDLTIGCTLNNTTLVNNGTLTVSGGDLKVNGSISLNDASTFNMSAGTITIDPNDGTASGSVASGTTVFNVGSSTAAITNNVTGGTILFNDPPFAGAGKTLNMQTNTNQTWAGSTVQFGGTTNTNTSTATNGFQVDCYLNSGRLALGNIIVNGNDPAKFVSDVTFGINAANNLIINLNSELRLATSLSTFAGNITNNGILTTTNALTLALVNGLATAAVASPNAQIISGSGVFRNSLTASTANLGGLTVINSSTAGVTIDVPLSTSGNLTLTTGNINTSATNILTLGTATVAGVLIGGSATSFINGPFARTFATRASAATYDQTTLYPVGKGTSYQPIFIAPTTTAATTLRSETFVTNTGIFVNPLVSLASRRWETTAIVGSANVTNAFVRQVVPTSTMNDVIAKSISAAGQYADIAPIVTTITATNLTSASALPYADLAFLSYGTKCTTPPAPTGASSQSFCGTGKTVADLVATASGGNTIKWYDAATSGTELLPSTALVDGTNYFASQIVTLGGCESTTRLAVAVTVTNVDNNITLVADTFTASQSGATYQWFTCPGNTIISGANSQTFTAMATGDYGVTVTLAGCSVNSSCVTYTTLGLENNILNSFKIYPNPTTSILNIEYTSDLTNVSVFNMLGQQVLTKKVTATSTQLDMSALTNGTYLVKVEAGNVSKTIKVFKK